MNFSININQKALSKFENADLVDGAIINHIHNFVISPSTEKKFVDGVIYYWISHQNIIDSNPLLGIKSKRGIRKRIDKLCQYKMLSPYEENYRIGKSFYAITSIFHELFVENKLNNLGTPVPTPRNASSDKYYTNEYYTNESSTNNKTAKQSLADEPKEIKKLFKNIFGGDEGKKEFIKLFKDKYKQFEGYNLNLVYSDITDWNNNAKKTKRTKNWWLVTAKNWIERTQNKYKISKGLNNSVNLEGIEFKDNTF